ncbi:Phosphotransferase enzyme family protein [Roseivivax lentus]|uniref:Phosphotransferase enzyme family protein n=1 Tax=Roseivivax lentus TaxID=633194 RepID=A0A1N7NY10_9RHOB|nr:phosphotransferase [Roseivivax lentus]SIT03210.1 Phosphotransferase enzyme family protein [Roseivivax lentus]
MYLTSGTLATYLLDRATVEPGLILSGDYQVVEAGRRNRNFKVYLKDGDGLFVKQAPMAMAEVHETLNREAIFHALVANRPAFAPLSGMCFSMRDYDRSRGTLTLELAATGRSLNEFLAQAGPDHPQVAQQLAQHLVTLHSATAAILADTDSTAHFPHRQPWVLHLPRNAETIMPAASAGQTGLVAQIRANPLLIQLLDTVAAEWRLNTFNHGDLKWENIVIVANTGEGAEADFTVKLVDWELCDIGDAGWDVGCIVAGYLQRLSLTATGAAKTPGLAWFAAEPDLITQETDSARRALAAFWHGYASAFGVLDGPHADLARQRVMRFAAVRLVLSAFEMAAAASAEAPHVTGLMQAAAAIFADPDRAGRNTLLPEIAA